MPVDLAVVVDHFGQRAGAVGLDRILDGPAVRGRKVRVAVGVIKVVKKFAPVEVEDRPLTTTSRHRNVFIVWLS